MIDLSCEYLGLKLAHPLVPGASPIVDDIDLVLRFEDAGAPAIVMHSLFEEQIEGEAGGIRRAWEESAESGPEAVSYLPSPEMYALGPEEYLGQLGRIKERVRIPVIASLNGSTAGGWLRYARLLEETGADALELNVYRLPTEPDESGAEVEERAVEIVRAVRRSVRIPLAVKLSPYYSALPHLAARLHEAGADGLVLFNRFLQPDLDVETLEVTPRMPLSTSAELVLRLRWLAILGGGRLGTLSLAASGGVHTAVDAVKALMAGAHVTQMVSALLQGGPRYLSIVRTELREWLEAHEYRSIAQLHGSLSLARCPDPAAFERAQYMRMLQGWRDPRGRVRLPPVQ